MTRWLDPEGRPIRQVPRPRRPELAQPPPVAPRSPTPKFRDLPIQGKIAAVLLCATVALCCLGCLGTAAKWAMDAWAWLPF